MQYLDNQHKILKYLCKFRYGVMKSHRKCLIPIGEDYKELETKEKTEHKDAVVDMNKLKSLFAERGTMSEDDFNTALYELVDTGYLTQQYALTTKGELKNKEIFKAYYKSDYFQNLPLSKNIDTEKLLFND